MASFSAFELVHLVTMRPGRAVITDYSVTGGMLTIGTFALLSVAMSFTNWRFPGSRAVLEGRPAVVVRDGVPQERVMADERLTWQG